MCADLPKPHRVGGVGYDGGSPLLSVVGEFREAAPFARLDGHLQVRVWVEEHTLLQAHSSDVCRGKHTFMNTCVDLDNQHTLKSVLSPDRVKLTSFRQCSFPDWSSAWPSLPTWGGNNHQSTLYSIFRLNSLPSEKKKQGIDEKLKGEKIRVEERNWFKLTASRFTDWTGATVSAPQCALHRA